MDARTKDAEGLTICPQCGKHYLPELTERKNNMAIQMQFPNATPMQREQLVTGICSDDCWNKFLGIGK